MSTQSVIEEEQENIFNQNPSSKGQGIITRDQDNINSMFQEGSFDTISSDRFDSEEIQEQNQIRKELRQEQNKNNTKSHPCNIQHSNSKEEEIYEVTQIGQRLRFSIEQAKKTTTLIEECCSQTKKIFSTEIQKLSENQDKLREILSKEDNEELEIIAMLFMLLIKVVDEGTYNLEEDPHLLQLYEIQLSVNDLSTQEQQQTINESDETSMSKEIEIQLENSFKNSLRNRLQ